MGKSAGEEWKEDLPIIAVNMNSREVVAVGERALKYFEHRETEVKIFNPYQSFSFIANDFELAESVMKTFVRKYLSSRFALISPIIIIQPLGYESELNGIEQRMFRELGIHCGARVVWILDHKETVSELELGKIDFKNALKSEKVSRKIPSCEITHWPDKSR